MSTKSRSVFDFIQTTTPAEKQPEPQHQDEQPQHQEQPEPQPPRPTLRIVTPPERPAIQAQPEARRIPQALPRRWDTLDPTAKASALRLLRTKAQERARNVVISLILGLAGGPAAGDELEELITIDRTAAARGYLTHEEHQRREEIAAAAVRRLRFDPLTDDGPCEPCEGMGWLHMNEDANGHGDIQRCDDCQAFPDDESASKAHALECGCPWEEQGPTDDDQGEQPQPQEDKPEPPAIVAPPPPRALGEGLSAPLRAGDWAGLWHRVQAGMITEEEARGFGALWKPRAQA